jgi:hypothetical protein
MLTIPEYWDKITINPRVAKAAAAKLVSGLITDVSLCCIIMLVINITIKTFLQRILQNS